MSRFPKNLVIAIDGPVAAGKTTTARLLAKRLGYVHIESGLMYRALAWKALQQDADLSDPEGILILLAQTGLELRQTVDSLRVLVDGVDVTDNLRSPRIQAAASVLSVHPRVREELVKRQRQLGAQGGVVMDGRDIGTVVFPHATVKFYLTAPLQERGRRRFRESPQDLGTLEKTMEEVEHRDRRDMERAASPLKPAADAIVIDTVLLSPDEVVSQMEAYILQKVKS